MSKMDDLGFKFQIGDIVATRGSNTHTVSGAPTWVGGDDGQRQIIVERVASECPGGVQFHYLCRGIHPGGNATKEYLRFNEIELEKSEPFRDETPEEIAKRAEERRKNRVAGGPTS